MKANRNKENTLTHEYVRANLDYRDGNLFWNRVGSKVHEKLAGWNSPNGYRYIGLNNYVFLIHRVIWFWHYNVWPEFIDHKDGNSLNNSIENLQDVTHTGNMKNLSMYSNNTTGVVGVVKRKKYNKWRAKIGHNGKRINIGDFNSIEEAERAVIEKRKELGYSATHGRKKTNEH